MGYMAVLKNNRTQGKSEVLTCAWNLCGQTMTLCKSEKRFPKRERWILVQPIIREAMDAMSCIRRANAVHVGSDAEYEYRHMQQVQAYGHLEALLTLIELAQNVHGLEAQTVEHWTGLVVLTENKLKAWAKSDKERFKKMKSDAAQ